LVTSGQGAIYLAPDESPGPDWKPGLFLTCTEYRHLDTAGDIMAARFASSGGVRSVEDAAGKQVY